MLVYLYILVFILSLVLSLFLVKLAPKIGLIDEPNSRSIHNTLTPRGAGIAIFLSVLVSLLIFRVNFIEDTFPVFIGISLVFLIGVLDDHNDAPPSAKIYVILLATLCLIFDGLTIRSLGEWWGYNLNLGLLAYPFTFFAVLAFTNALNLIDGLDGLSSGISITILSSFLFIGYINQDTILIVLSSVFIVSLLAFLVVNWHPAKIFMGDSGSLVLGFVISMLAIRAIDYIPPVSILLIAAIPIMDSIIVLVRRRLNGVSFATADRTHIHHILLNFFGGDVKRTVVTLILLQGFYSYLGITIADKSNQLVIFVLFNTNLIIYYLLFTNMHKQQAKKKERQYMRNIWKEK